MVTSKLKQITRYTLTLVALLLLMPAASLAAATKSTSSSTSSSTTPAADNISTDVTQSYDSGTGVQLGMIVELQPKNPNYVIPLPSTDIQGMLGVVVPATNATIVLTPTTVTQQQVLVATSGTHDVLVSNQAGPIKIGDYITISAISGVGMKAGEGDLEVVGKAEQAFSGTSDVIGSIKETNTLGQTTTVAIGRIAINLAVSHNPLFQKTSDYVPGFLAKVAQTVSGKPVSVARIYLGLAIIFVTSFITGNMLYSGVRSGMIAVGRNPLSKKSIIKSLIQTVMAGLTIFIVGIFAVYLLLKL